MGPKPRRDDFHITNVGDTVIWVIKRLGDVFARIATSAIGDAPLRIAFLPEGEAVEGAAPLRLAGINAGTLQVAWDARIWDQEEERRGTIQSLLGEIVVQGLTVLAPRLGEEHIRDLRAAWAAAAPAFSLDIFPLPYRAQGLPAPTATPDPMRAEMRRELAVYLREQGTAPGLYAGDDAAAIESRLLYPHLVARLHAACAPYSLDGLLAVASYELECATARRVRRRLELDANVRGVSVAFDPITRAVKQEEEGSILARSLATIIELALQDPPTGSSAPDRIGWMRILACAELLVESGLRSESIHYRVSPIVTEVTDQFEVQRRDEGIPLFDTAKFRRAQMAERLPSPWSPSSPIITPGAENNDEEGGGGLLTTFPELSSIDTALRLATGCGIESLLGVLARLQEWPVTAQHPVAAATTAEIVTFCSADGALSSVEAEAALDLLTLRGTDLRGDIETWELSKRAFRLVTRPIIANPDGRLLILPWSIGESLRIYTQYLDDGRLPWPERIMDSTLTAALRNYRQRLNTALEREVGDILRGAGFAVRLNVKKPQVIGLKALSGEIDALAARPSGDTLWVVEVKNPALVFSVSEMERAVRAFHEPISGYLSKLHRKVADVKTEPVAVALTLGVPGSLRRVRGLMVTRRPVPAAFAEIVPVPFVTVEELASWISREESRSDVDVA